MQLRYDTTDTTIAMPQWGYSVKIVYPFVTTKLSNKKYAKWDSGANYDKRYLNCSWLMQLSEAETLSELFRDPAKGRGKIITFKLGATETGFFPFGVDKGDKGDFQAVLTDLKLPASQGHPSDLFTISATFMFVGSYPAYSLPTVFPEGNLTVGTCANLRYPEAMHDQSISHGVTVKETENYSAYVLDRGISADSYEAGLNLDLLGANMAKLVDFLSGASGRASDITVTPPANSYLFGIVNGSTDDYTCKWLDNELEIVHNGYDQFSTSINLGLN